MQSLSRQRFLIFIVLPLFFAVASMVLLTFGLVDRLASGVNAADQKRSQQIVASAISSVQTEMAAVASDNGQWDDAASNVYRETSALDAAWFDATWGTVTKTAAIYDMFAVVDRINPNALVAWKNGEQISLATNVYFGGQLEHVLNKLPETIAEHDSTGAVFRSPDGLLVVGIATVNPTSDVPALQGQKPRYFIVGRYLTPERLSQLGSQYVISDLAYDEMQKRDNGLAIFDPGGVQIGVLSWKDSRPGDSVRTESVKKVYPLLALLVLIATGLALLCWRMFGNAVGKEQDARHRATHDPVTNLLNLDGLAEIVKSAPDSASEPLAIAQIEVDGIDAMNELYGKETADSLTKTVAVGLRERLSPGISLSRVEGQIYAAAASGPKAEERISGFARSALAFLAQPFAIEGRHASLKAYAGIAEHASGADNIAESMRRAAVAVKSARHAGPSSLQTYTISDENERNARLLITAELKKLIAAKTVEILWQPVVSVTSGKITAVEALARWPSQLKPSFPVDKFLQVAEAEGLIDSLGDVILELACHQAANWSNIKIGINVSAIQLLNPSFVTRALEIVSQSKTATDRIELEISAASLAGSGAKIDSRMQRLQAVGIGFVLDDFGLTTASFDILGHLDFQRIKIDRQITEKITRQGLDQKIAHSVVQVANGVSAAITAKGVETEEQARLLSLAGCNELQGYYFCPPVSAEKISSLLAQEQLQHPSQRQA
jgi:EAL domain-containing protein (putative c-di-GMP-specific phosphodiesterase class I)/GGDEF domain-containing protein